MFEKNLFLRVFSSCPKTASRSSHGLSPKLRSTDDMIKEFWEYTQMVKSVPYDPIAKIEPRCTSQSELHTKISKSNLQMELTDNDIRIGRLIEMIDLIAPCAAYKHNRKDTSLERFIVGSQPRIFVTGKFHPVNLRSALLLKPNEDITLVSKVTATQKTRSEVTIHVVQNQKEFFQMKIDFVSLHGHNPKQKIATHQLLGINDQIQRFHNPSNIVQPLSEVGLMQRDLKEGEVSMASTQQILPLKAYREFQNPYQTVFGGWIARSAIESAKMCAVYFAGESTQVAALEDARFLKVAQINDRLQFRSVVSSVNQCANQFTVTVYVEKMENLPSKVATLCDRFAITFEVPKEHRLPMVVPETTDEFDEFMKWKKL